MLVQARAADFNVGNFQMRHIGALALLLLGTSFATAALPAPGTTYHLLFATNELYGITNSAAYPPMPGVFGGLATADWQATYAAANAGLPATENWDGLQVRYHAILSTSTTSAFSRLTVNGPVFNTHGSRLAATGKIDLFDGELEHPVDYDEYGNYIETDPDVWSGCTSTGVWGGSSCMAWNNPATGGQLGSAFAGDSSWLSTGGIKPCNQSARIYGISDPLIAPLWGDFNNDNSVDAADYTLWRDKLGTTATTTFTSALSGGAIDVDFSGVIDEGDYEIWKEYFGTTLPASALAIPEPTAAVLLVIGMSGLAGHRRRW